MLGEEENFETGGNKTLEKVKKKFFYRQKRISDSETNGDDETSSRQW